MPIKRNIRLMYAIALLQGMVFYAPIASLYRQAAGLNLAQIALIESISYIAAFALELPWGILADRIGYRRTMLACCGFYFLSKLVFWQAYSFSSFLVERILLSIALAGFSGVDESILYLSCAPGESQRVFGRCNACSTAGLLISSFIYLRFMENSHRPAAFASMVAYAIAMLPAFFLVEPVGRQARSRTSLRDFSRLLKQCLRNRRLLVFIAGFALFQEAVQMVSVWLNQNQYLRCGMGEAGIGAAHIFMNLAMLSGARSGYFTRRLGADRFSAAALLVPAAACILLIHTRSAYLSCVLVALVAAGRALLAPLYASTLNDSISSENRASCLSIFALLQSCVSAGAQAIYGRAAVFSLDAAFALCALSAVAAWFAFRGFRSGAAE